MRRMIVERGVEMGVFCYILTLLLSADDDGCSWVFLLKKQHED